MEWKYIQEMIEQLKKKILSLSALVEERVYLAVRSILSNDTALQKRLLAGDNEIDRKEVEVEEECLKILALHQPVAIDLRFVLAVLKINSNLERIGDIADGIARYVIEADAPFHGDLLKVTRLDEMYTLAIEMLEDVRKCFNEEDTRLARGVFKKDDVLDDINGSANRVVEALIRKEAEHIAPALHIISTIRKLERTGDQVKNIAEEIIFYLEAKVLKHGSSKVIED